MTRSVERLSVNVAPDVADALRWIAGRNGWTITEATRRLVGLGVAVQAAADLGDRLYTGRTSAITSGHLSELRWP